MTNVVTPGLAVMYIWSTGEHAPATIIGRSIRGDDFINLKYTRNGHEIEHNAPFEPVLFPIRSPVTTILLRVRYGQVFGDIRSFDTAVARKHPLVQAPGPSVTVVFLTFLVLAQGRPDAFALP